MKAAVCAKYGSRDVLALRELKKSAPKRDEVCIEMHATTVTSSDRIVGASISLTRGEFRRDRCWASQDRGDRYWAWWWQEK